MVNDPDELKGIIQAALNASLSKKVEDISDTLRQMQENSRSAIGLLNGRLDKMETETKNVHRRIDECQLETNRQINAIALSRDDDGKTGRTMIQRAMRSYQLLIGAVIAIVFFFIGGYGKNPISVTGSVTDGFQMGQPKYEHTQPYYPSYNGSHPQPNHPASPQQPTQQALPTRRQRQSPQSTTPKY